MKLFKKQPFEAGRRERTVRDPGQKTATFSYHSSRAEVPGNAVRQLQQEDQKPAPKLLVRYSKVERFGIIIVFVVVVIAAVMSLSLSSTPKIVVLSTADQKPFLENTSIYSQAATKQFAESILNKNKITVNTGTISRHLLSEFPELTSVSTTIPLLSNQAVVYIQPAQPAIVFNASNGSYVLDTAGRALQSTTNFSNLANLHLSTVTDQSAYRVKIGDQALTANDVTFIQVVTYELAAHKVSISSFNLPAGTSELDAVISGQPYYVKFNLENNDPRQQAGSFLAVQAQLESQHLTSAHYIDVRVDGRAYYQ